MTSSHSEKLIHTADKPIASYIINKTKSKFKKSMDSTQSHKDNQICDNSTFSEFSLENDYQEEEQLSIDGDSSFDSSFDEVDTAEINEDLMNKYSMCN